MASRTLLVAGYYGEDNLGDESYQVAMRKFFPHFHLTFVHVANLTLEQANDYDGLVVGGGDIINNYFHGYLRDILLHYTKPKFAFSIGIPFPSLINEEYLGYYDHIFLRNYEDVRAVQRVVGSHRAHYLPDVSFSYPYLLQPAFNRAHKRCGVFVVGNLIRFPNIVEDLIDLVVYLTESYQVTLYTFHPAEDVALNLQIKETIACRYDGREVEVNYHPYSPQAMIEEMGQLDFAVCMRYHAHIFATLVGLPFLSISSTRKTRSLMTQMGLEKYQHRIKLNEEETPISSDYSKLKCTYDFVRSHSYEMKDQLSRFLLRCRFLLSDLQADRLMRHLIAPADITDFLHETKDYHNGARLLTKCYLNNPDSGYNWGITQKLAAASGNWEGTVVEIIKHLGTTSGVAITCIQEENPCIPEEKLPLYVDLTEYETYRTPHRGGWYLACQELAKYNSVNSKGVPNGLICDMYLDRTFHWAKNYFKHRGIIPYTSPWVGFIHHTANTSYSNYNIGNLFRDDDFRRSLYCCKVLFTLSETLARTVREHLCTIDIHVKVVALVHPVDTPEYLFSIRAYRDNPHPKLINIGAWLRNPLAIYQLSHIPLTKAVLVGKDMDDYLPPDNFTITNEILIPGTGGTGGGTAGVAGVTAQVDITPCRGTGLVACRDSLRASPRWVQFLTNYLTQEGISVIAYAKGKLQVDADLKTVALLNQQVKTLIASVDTIPFQNNEQYDYLLSRNIVFLNLIDAAAVNTIIECIVRRTPIVVNRIPGTVALLGEDYPLFYDSLSLVPELLSLKNIEKAHRYLSRLDVKPYRISSFIKAMKKLFSGRY